MAQTRTGGVGILGVLTIVFLVLKLGHVVTWPWVVVLAPLWVPFACLATIWLVLVVR